MKILVPFKRVADYNSDASGDDRWIINPFDEIAIEEALRIRERGEANEVVGVTIASDEAEEQVRAALAMGVDRAIRIDDTRVLDPYATARILVALVRREQPQLVIMGKQAIDGDSNQTGQMLAGLLGWPQATFISSIELVDTSSKARCARETDDGIEVVEVLLPAVVTTDLRLNEPRYVSLPSLMKARRQPIETITCEELGTDVHPRTTVLKTDPAPRRSAGIQVESLEDLLARLHEDEKLI